MDNHEETKREPLENEACPKPVRKRRHIAFYIAFPIGVALLTFALVFYLDLANGPLACLIAAMVLVAGLVVSSVLLRDARIRFRLIPWGAFLLSIGVVLGNARPSTQVKSAAYYDNPVSIETPLVLDQGKIQGLYNQDKDVEIYAGIPYAEAPVGELRWKEPRPVKPWEGVKDCTHFAPRAMQVDTAPVMSGLIDMYSEKGWHPDFAEHPLQNMSEDCLYLNVWAPKDAVDAPVLVYIHGGSLTGGSSGDDSTNGEAMAKKGIVTVTVAYRLGVFGYLALPELAQESPNGTTGNYGLLDQIAAVKWVYDNIASFGGDPRRITIAGESAGSSSVSAICTTPLLRGTDVVRQAIGESSSIAGAYPPHTFRTLEDAYKEGEKLKKEQGKSTLSDLRSISAERLVKTATTHSSMTLEGYALDKMPNEVYRLGLNNEKALLNGYNVKEGDAFIVPGFLFSPTNKDNIEGRLAEIFEDAGFAKKVVDLCKDKIEADAFSALNEIVSVHWFMYPHYEWSNLALDNGETVYRYQFTKENGFHGNYHSGEIIYAYGNIAKSGHSFAYDESDYKLQDTMLGYWSNFVKTGNPNGGNLPVWAPYEKGVEKVLELGSEVKQIDERYLGLYGLLKDYVPSPSESEE